VRKRALATAIAFGVTIGALGSTASHAGMGERATAGVAHGVAAEAVPYASMIHATATRHGLPPHLVEAVIRAESNFDARAVSPKGAMGLMQLMPGTAVLLGVRNPFDVKQNVEGGVRHLVDLLYRFSGNLRLALAAYNAGEETVRRYGGVPPYPETVGYVERIVASYERGASQRSSSHAPAPGLGAAVDTSKDAARVIAAVAAAAPTEPDRSVVYRYETEDGAVVFTNVPRRPGSPSAGTAASVSPPTSW
jgi:soluble lytic murein transglycosylase-like protein